MVTTLMVWDLWIPLNGGNWTEGKNVLLLGAGGSARAICVYLLKKKLTFTY